MLNQVVLVGRLIADIEVIEKENGDKVCTLTVACPQVNKNKDGIYETDNIKCILLDNFDNKIAEYCKKGTVMSIKGRVRESKEDNGIEIVAEKITCLSSKSS